MDHCCLKEREIDDLKKEFDNLKSLQYTDHDLLIRIDTKLDTFSNGLATLSQEIKEESVRPAKMIREFKEKSSKQHSLFVFNDTVPASKSFMLLPTGATWRRSQVE